MRNLVLLDHAATRIGLVRKFDGCIGQWSATFIGLGEATRYVCEPSPQLRKRVVRIRLLVSPPASIGPAGGLLHVFSHQSVP
jgi:hypothetical protein